MQAITFSKIKARERAMCSNVDLSTITEAETSYALAYDSIKKNRSTIQEDTFKFFHNCVDSISANKYYDKCLSILESVKDNNYISSMLESVFVNEIVPYIKNLEDLKEATARKNISMDIKQHIFESVKIYKVCDRILTNNEKLSKRFDFDKYIKENSYMGKKKEMLLLTLSIVVFL